MKLILPIVLALLGLGAGLAAGHFLRPPPEAGGDSSEKVAAVQPEKGEEGSPSEFIQLDKQFVVPLVETERVNGLVLLSLSLEVEPGMAETVFEREPKIRDRLLQAMFLHARSGGFGGEFTAGPAMADLRGSLRESARDVAGTAVRDVLVTDILRQDL